MAERDGKARIGIAGVGLMGLGIASNIARAGWPLSYLEHGGNQPVDGLNNMGAVGVSNGEALAQTSDIIILCVTGSPQVEDVLTRRNGVLAGMRPGTIIIDCSTAIPSASVKMAEKAASAGGRFLDAPMTRTPKEAMEGRLNLIVGGDEALLAEVRPLLECFAENITHVGGIGAGHAMKLLHNFVSLGQALVIAEAAAAAGRAGANPAVFADILAKGGGGGAALERMMPFISSGDVASFKFSIQNAHKDISYYCAMSDDLNAEKHVAEGAFTMLNDALGNGHGGRYLPELIAILRS